jgi:hypothetical protein
MRTWKIIALGTGLIAALIVIVSHRSSGGFAGDGVAADRTTSSPQKVQRVPLVADRGAPRESPDAARTNDVEPWGPFRTTDW